MRMESPMFIIEVPEDLKEGFPVFIDRRHKDLEALELALSNSDANEIYEIGHRMKGTGSVYGFSELTKIGSELVRLSEAKELDSLKEVVTQLKYALNNYKLKAN